jgi:hypothetical protein
MVVVGADAARYRDIGRDAAAVACALLWHCQRIVGALDSVVGALLVTVST